MSFSWAVTDHSRSPPIKPDPFRGYFTEIQRAARRSLPRKPDRELRDLLGLTLVPAGNETDRANYINKQLKEDTAHQDTVKESEIVCTAEKPDSKISKTSFAQRIVSKLPCTTKPAEDCTEREKIISSFAVYLALVIIILLIIVIILAATISAFNKGDDNSSSIVGLFSDGNSSTTTSTYTTPSFKTLTSSTLTSGSTIKLLNVSKVTSLSQPTSTSITDSVLTDITTVTLPERSESRTSATTTSIALPSTTVVSSVLTSKSFTTSDSITSTSPVPTKHSTSRTSILTSTLLSSTQTTTEDSIGDNTTVTSEPSVTSGSSSISASSLSTSALQLTNSSTRLTSTSSPTMGSLSSELTTLPMTTTKSTRPDTTNVLTESTSSASSSTSTAPLPLIDKTSVSCTTAACLAASRSLARVSFGTSPCLDFYDFACGGWVDNTESRQTDSSQRNVPSTLREELRLRLLRQLQGLLQGVYYDTDSLTVRVSRRLYQSCLESNINGNTELGEVEYHKTLTELQEVLSRLGMTDQGVIQTNLDLLISESRSSFEITPFFKTSRTILDDGNGGRVFGITLSPPDLYLDIEEYRQPYASNKLAQLYVTRVADVLYTYLSSFNSNGIPGVPGMRKKRSARNRRQNQGISYEETYLKVLQSFNIDLNIAELIDETRESVSGQTIVTFSSLKESYQNLNWDAALGLRSDSALVLLENPEYFIALNKVLPDFNEEDVKLFIFLTVLIQRVWSYVPYPLRNILRDVSRDGNILYSEIDCVEKTIQLAHEETHALYVGEYTQAVLQNRVSVANLKSTVSQVFQDLLSQSTWVMSDLKRVVSVLLTNTKLTFSPVKVYIRETEGMTGAHQSFLSLAVELHGQKHGYEIFLVTTSVDENTLISDWTSTHLSFDRTLNLIGIPTGISVFLNNNNQPSFEFHGFVGFMLAEEIIKVLTGEMINGTVPEWWGIKNINRFMNIKECFQRQLSLDLHGQFDVGDVIIANSGLQIICEKTLWKKKTLLVTSNVFFFHDVLKKHSAHSNHIVKLIMFHTVFAVSTPSRQELIQDTSISEEMLFFINSAQLECTVETSYEQQKIRVNNRISNSGRFAETFSCPLTSPMVADQQCLVFS